MPGVIPAGHANEEALHPQRVSIARTQRISTSSNLVEAGFSATLARFGVPIAPPGAGSNVQEPRSAHL